MKQWEHRKCANVWTTSFLVVARLDSYSEHYLSTSVLVILHCWMFGFCHALKFEDCSVLTFVDPPGANDILSFNDCMHSPPGADDILSFNDCMHSPPTQILALPQGLTARRQTRVHTVKLRFYMSLSFMRYTQCVVESVSGIMTILHWNDTFCKNKSLCHHIYSCRYIVVTTSTFYPSLFYMGMTS